MDARTAFTRCAAQIRASAEKREYGEAVRVFKEFAARSRPMRSAQVIGELRRIAGDEAIRVLVKSFALAPCYYCELGRISCEQCGGANTMHANGQYCDDCGGRGHTACGFCGGTGFLSFDDVPTRLLEAVLKRRLTWVAGTLQGVLDYSKGLDVRPGHGGVTRDVFHRMSDATRIAAILADTEPLLKTAGRGAEAASRTEKMAKLARQCRELNSRSAARLGIAISAHFQAQAEREPEGSAQRTMWERRRDYFASLMSDVSHPS
jgi:hypothetical protein